MKHIIIGLMIWAALLAPASASSSTFSNRYLVEYKIVDTAGTVVNGGFSATTAGYPFKETHTKQYGQPGPQESWPWTGLILSGKVSGVGARPTLNFSIEYRYAQDESAAPAGIVAVTVSDSFSDAPETEHSYALGTSPYRLLVVVHPDP